MKKLITAIIFIVLTSCDSPPKKPVYELPTKPKFIADAEDKEKKLKIINEKLSSTDSIIVNEGQHELVEIFKKDKNLYIQFLKGYKSKDSIGYALFVNKVMEIILERLGPDGFKKANQVAKKDKAKFLEISRNAGIIPNGYEIFFEDYNPYAKVAVEKQKEKKKVDKPIIINSEPIPKEGSSNLNL